MKTILRRFAPITLATTAFLLAGTAAAASYFYSFSNMSAGTTFSFGDSLAASGSTIEFKKFQWDNGTWDAGGTAKVVLSARAGGFANELNLNNINVRVIPDALATTAGFKYADLGGNVNLGVNGDLRNVEQMISLDGDVVGGCDIAVTEVPIIGGVRGDVDITCPPETLDMFGVGGQEFYIDGVHFAD